MIHLRLGLLLFIFLGDYSFGYAQSKSKFVIHDQSEIVLQNARVVDVVKGTVLEGYALHLSNGKIKAIGKTGALQFPDSAQVIDLAGKTVLPGLVMVYEHMIYNRVQRFGIFNLTVFPNCILLPG